MFSRPDCGQGDDSVPVIGSGDDDGVDVLLLFEHYPEITVHFGLRVGLESVGGISRVHIAQGHDVLGGTVLEVLAAHAAHADAGDVEFVAGGVGAAQHMARKQGEGGGRYRGRLQEVASRGGRVNQGVFHNVIHKVSMNA